MSDWLVGWLVGWLVFWCVDRRRSVKWWS